MDTPVVELIKGLVQVRDGLALIAFLTLALLIAFRTKKVPELFFGLVRDKLTREQFAALLHRFMTLGFILFLVLAALTLASQALSSWTRADALTVSDLKSELAKTAASTEQQLKAESKYLQAVTLLNERRFDAAIASLKESINAVPSLTAQEMLVHAYRQSGDSNAATDAWAAAKKTALEQGDSLAVARLDAGFAPVARIEEDGETDLIDPKLPLPRGGPSFAGALDIAPGLYVCSEAGGCQHWLFSIRLVAGQQLVARARTTSSQLQYSELIIFGTNGEQLDYLASASQNAIMERKLLTTKNGKYFIRVALAQGAPVRVYVR